MANFKSRSKAGLERIEAQEALETFLDPKNEAKVFALKGDWGVGKTHLVKSFLVSREKDYCYSSAFGISSIDGLKIQLWSNYQSFKKEEKPAEPDWWNAVLKRSVGTTKKNIESVEKLIKAIPGVGEIGGIVATSAYY